MDIRTQRLNEAFNASGLTQTELCEKTGLTKGAVSSYLSGRYFPKQKTIERLAEALNVSIPYLMGYNEADYTVYKASNDDSNETYYLEPEVAKMAQELHDRPEMKVLFDASKKLSKEDLEAVTSIIEKLSKK
jgi:transcriptional regulator with XRE-family HTH domain